MVSSQVIVLAVELKKRKHTLSAHAGVSAGLHNDIEQARTVFVCLHLHDHARHPAVGAVVDLLAGAAVVKMRVIAAGRF